MENLLNEQDSEDGRSNIFTLRHQTDVESKRKRTSERGKPTETHEKAAAEKETSDKT